MMHADFDTLELYLCAVQINLKLQHSPPPPWAFEHRQGLGILKPRLNGVVNLDECNTGILT